MALPRPFRPGLAFLLFALFMVSVVGRLEGQAQATTGVIRGVISDSSTGAPLAGATVSLVNRETNAQRSLTTNASGVYVATLLRVGTYNVTARALGFKAVDHGLHRRISETLALGQVLLDFADR